jgi:DNA-binding SARP family transcriptional activator
MQGHDEVLAKIARPRSRHVFKRTGLFQKLDGLLDSPGIWIGGPPGSGKTTLVSSYIRQRKCPFVWYQIDESDSDLATMFWYLRAAASKVAPRDYAKLPTYSDAYRLGIKAFAHNYFAQYFALLPPGSAIVIDDLHLCEENQDLCEVLARAISVLPRNINIFILSRETPPPQFCRLLGNQLLQTIGWSDLRLDATELRAIAKIQCPSVTEESLVKLARQVDGWAAGLVLKLQGSDADVLNGIFLDHSNHEALFGYFAYEVLNRHSPADRDVLLQLALMPKMTQAMACELAGDETAAGLLNELQRRNYFVDLQALQLPTYSFHPLFRVFLLEQLRLRFSEAEVLVLRKRAGEVLETAGHSDAAIDLYMQAGEWPALVRLILKRAPELMEQGRVRHLANHICAVPAKVRESNPWLLYWCGMCHMFSRSRDAHACFAKAYEKFRADSNRVGALKAWSGAVSVLFAEWSDVEAINAWVVEGEQGLQLDLDKVSDPAEANAIAIMCFALFICRPYSPKLRRYAEQTHGMIEMGTDTTFMLMATNLLLIFYAWMGDLTRATLLVETVRSRVAKDNCSDAHKIMWAAADAWGELINCQPHECLRISSGGLQLAADSGMHIFDYKFHGMSAQASLLLGRPKEAREALMRYQQVAPPEANLLRFHVHNLSAWSRWLSGEPAAARKHLELAVSFLESAGSPPIVAAKTQIGFAILHFDAGEEHDGRAMLARAMKAADVTGSAWLKYHCLLIEADLARRNKQMTLCCLSLREAFAIARCNQLTVTDWWDTTAMSRLCELALANDIEVEYVAKIIKATSLQPAGPPATAIAWPWKIRIYLLGDFRMIINGETIIEQKIGQKKVLALLKQLAAAGGEKISAAHIADTIWPDAEGDDARNALKTTVHRLRKYVGDANCIEFSDGCVRLNTSCCWTDVAAFIGLTDTPKSSSERRENLRQALSLYAGPLLSVEDEVWVIAPRAKLQRIAHDIAMELGLQYESRRKWARAISIYRPVFDANSTDEQVCRHLMTCYESTGREDEALATFAQCQSALAATMAKQPAARTIGLVQSMMHQIK